MVHFKIFLLKSFKGFCIKELNGKEYFLSHQQYIKILYQLHVHTYIMCKSNCYRINKYFTVLWSICVFYFQISFNHKRSENDN